MKLILALLKRLFPLAAVLLAASCAADPDLYDVVGDPSEDLLREKLTTLFGSPTALQLPTAAELDRIPADPNNPLTPEKIALGKFLFHETALGTAPVKAEGMQTYSCASCHHASAGFQSGTLQGIGEGGSGYGLLGEARRKSDTYAPEELDVQPIRSPTILNTAYQEAMLWNGQFGATGINTGTEPAWTPGTPKETNTLGFEGLETQAIAGIGVHRLHLASSLLTDYPLYKTLFDSAFHGVPEDQRYSDRNAGLAIAAYERTVLPDAAPFQVWLRGNPDAMSAEEKQGALLFFGKGKCFQCHSGPGMNGMSFHALGMGDFDPSQVAGPVGEAIRKGRGGFTGKDEDFYTFKVPTLYNLKGLRFFGHGGSFSSVAEVIRYKNAGIPENAGVPEQYLSAEFTPLYLDEQEVYLLTRFVEEALFDPNLQRYEPEALPSGLCFPVADPASRQDLGCD